MSDHLPECFGDVGLGHLSCICDRLRKAEQRERQRSVLLIADAYGKGLDAAREAVAALPVHKPNVLITLLDYADALAAIDALTDNTPSDEGRNTG